MVRSPSITSVDRGWRYAVIVVLDLAAWPIALATATSFYGRDPLTAPTPALIATAILVQFVVGTATGLYRGRFNRFSFEEAGAVAVATGATGLFVVVFEQLSNNVARGGQVVVMSTSLAVCLMFGHRYARQIRARRIRAIANSYRTPVIVYGAGEGGDRAIRGMQDTRNSPYRPVAILDDDPRARGHRIDGVRVEGSIDDVERVAQRYGCRHVLLAIPGAGGDELQELHRQIEAAGFETLIMPPVQRLVGRGSPREITEYSDEEVRSRKIVDFSDDIGAGIVRGATVLVTGAGGSIGTELIRQLAELEPAALVMVDHDDTRLQALAATVGPRHLASCVTAIADIRDVERLDDVVGQHQPDIVFHTAALTLVDALEQAPSEGWKTNVLGTANVLDVCLRHGVRRVVNLSSDDAVEPTNVLGYTKRIAERLTSAASRRSDGVYMSVRVGSVLGTRGSTIETFAQQIADGGPVTISHPDATSHFIAVREAVGLTIQAAAIGRPGEVLVLDMGTPVKVLTIAEQLIEQSGRTIEIEYTGLRPGERLHDQLVADDERAERPLHAMIDHVDVPPLDLVQGIDACAAENVRPTSVDGLALMARTTLPTRGDKVTDRQNGRRTPATRRTS